MHRGFAHFEIIVLCIDYPLQDAAETKQRGLHGVTMLAYSALLSLGLVLSSPWWLLRLATTQRYREGMRQRLGAVPAQLLRAVQGKRVVWLHAVSVGEVLAASRLLGELESALGAGFRVVISTTTRTGQALARERFGAESVFYMPLDFAFAVRAYLNALKPAALILMESELWPRMLHECPRLGVPVAVVNARMSDRSFNRSMRVQPVWGRVMRKPTLWLAQSEQDALRLVIVGVRTNSVQVAGNLKYDVRAPKQSRIAELIREAAAARKIIVAGSTLGGDPSEESLLIRAVFSGLREPTGALLVLAPRHPERFADAYSIASECPTLRATQMLADDDARQSQPALIRKGDANQPEIIVLDTVGDLAAVYAVADVAFIGGSLVKRGGHNPLEPAQFGVPIVMGPSFENFRDIVAKMREAHGIRIVQDNDELASALIELLTNRTQAKAMGERGRRVFEQQQGATARSVEALVAMIHGTSPDGATPHGARP